MNDRVESSPDLVVEMMRGGALFFEEDLVNMALARMLVVAAGGKKDAQEEEALTLLKATLLEVPYIIVLDDADDDGLRLVRSPAESLPLSPYTLCRPCSSSPPPARAVQFSSRPRRWRKRR